MFAALRRLCNGFSPRRRVFHTLDKTRGGFTSIRMLIREKRKKRRFSFFSYLFSEILRLASLAQDDRRVRVRRLVSVLSP